MHTQLLYIYSNIYSKAIYTAKQYIQLSIIYSKAIYTAKHYIQQSNIYSNYYKVTNALVLTQCLHTQLHCDSENQTQLHFIFKWLQQSFCSDTEMSKMYIYMSTINSSLSKLNDFNHSTVITVQCHLQTAKK